MHGETKSGITISIVTYNTWERTARCVSNLIDSDTGVAFDYEVLIVNNGRPELSYSENGVVRILTPRENLGFGRGNNLALGEAQYDHFLILNPDTTVDLSSVGRLMRYLDSHPEIALLAPLLRMPNGSLQHSLRKFPSLKTELSRIFMLDGRVGTKCSTLVTLDSSRPLQIVDQVAGAAIMSRTADLRSLGGFDPGFRMYFEDVDLCMRASALGRIAACSEVEFGHDAEGTAKGYRTRSIFWIERSRRQYFAKHASFTMYVVYSTIGIISAITHAVVLLLAAVTSKGAQRRVHLSKAFGYILSIVAAFGLRSGSLEDRFMART